MKDTANKYRYLYKNTAIFAVSSFSTKILSFLFIPIYTAVLTTTEYGTADLINTTGILLIYILTVNIADSVLRFSIEKVEDSEKILSFGIKVLFTGTIICALLLGLACYVELSNWPVIYYVFIFLFFVSSAFYQIMTNYLRGIDKVSAVACDIFGGNNRKQYFIPSSDKGRNPGLSYINGYGANCCINILYFCS